VSYVYASRQLEKLPDFVLFLVTSVEKSGYFLDINALLIKNDMVYTLIKANSLVF